MFLWGLFCKYAVDLRGVLLPKNGFMELRSGFIEIMLRCGCSSVGLLRIFRAPFPESTSGKLLLSLSFLSKNLHNSFQVFVILFKSREITITYIPSITSDQLHAFLISNSSVNYVFSFFAVHCLYYAMCLLSSKSSNTQM